MARRDRVVSVPVGSRGPRRLTLWSGVAVGSTTQTGSGGVITNSGNAALLALRPFTIVRTYMEFLIFSDQVVADESQVAAVAGAVVSDQALAIGASAVPTPVTDAGSDLFFYHRFLFNRFTVSATTPTSIQASAGTKYTIDSKAMRKVNDDQDVIFLVELSTAGGGWTVISGGRILLKLH